jgi:hypothetical protein
MGFGAICLVCGFGLVSAPFVLAVPFDGVFGRFDLLSSPAWLPHMKCLFLSSSRING